MTVHSYNLANPANHVSFRIPPFSAFDRDCFFFLMPECELVPTFSQLAQICFLVFFSLSTSGLLQAYMHHFFQQLRMRLRRHAEDGAWMLGFVCAH